jgi:hypothetical protein
LWIGSLVFRWWNTLVSECFDAFLVARRGHLLIDHIQNLAPSSPLNGHILFFESGEWVVSWSVVFVASAPVKSDGLVFCEGCAELDCSRAVGGLKPLVSARSKFYHLIATQLT